MIYFIVLVLQALAGLAFIAWMQRAPIPTAQYTEPLTTFRMPASPYPKKARK